MESASLLLGSPVVMAYPNPHVPPFPSPTLVQPVAQLRQPYLVTTIGAAASGARKHASSQSSGGGSGHGGSGSTVAPEDVPIRLAVAFAPNRARLAGFSQSNIFGRHQRRMADALFVVANHGVLLEYTLDPIPDSSKTNLQPIIFILLFPLRECKIYFFQRFFFATLQL